MKKRLALILAISVAIIIAVSMLLFPTADTAQTTLDVSSGEGITFDNLGLYLVDEPMSETPVTYEAWVKLPAGYTEDPGTIFANYRGAAEPGIRLRLRTTTSGTAYPALMYTGTSSSNYISFNFTKVNAAQGDWVHLTLVDDVAGGKVSCYVNGELVQSITQTDKQKAFTRDASHEDYHFVIGGENASGTNYFKGNIRSVAVYDDIRTAEEIKADMSVIDLTDANLISAYNLNGRQGMATIQDATGNYNVTHNRKSSDWATPEEMPDLEDFEYSIALIGDTQCVNKYYPEHFGSYFDWLLENKEEHKIEHVLNLGDITNDNTDAEWDRAVEGYFRLNGEIDYTLVRGDHDVLTDTDGDDTNGDDTTKYDRWFGVPAYTDRFTNSADADYYKDAETGSITNSYRVVDIGTQQYLIVTMDKYPSEEVLTWLDEGINAMVAKYPEIKIIMTMHCFIQSDGNYIKASSTGLIGTDIWERIKGYKNLEYVICGHEYSYGVVWLKAEADDGHIVNQILVNPQGPTFDWNGASAMIAMLYFQADGDVEVRYYSPTSDMYFVGNNNPVNSSVSGTTYLLQSSMFTMNPDDDSAAAQLTRADLKQVEYIGSDTTISAVANGSEVSVNYSTDNVTALQNGKIIVRYDATKLSNPTVSPSSMNVVEGEGKLIVSWEGLSVTSKSTEGTLFTVSFDSNVVSGDPAYVGVDVVSLGYESEGTAYLVEDAAEVGTGVTADEEVVIYYESGDDFKTTVEQALRFAKYSDVKLVMKTGFTAAENTVIGNADSVPEYTVYITSEDANSPQTINTSGNIITLAGKYNIDNVVLAGGSMASNANAIFFPEGSKAVLGTAITAGSTKTSVCGDDIEINSGEYHYVGANIVKNQTVTDPSVKLQGTAKAARVLGGACGSGDVIGKTYLYIGGSAEATNYAAPSSYAVKNSAHDGSLVVDTTGKIGRICGMIGPGGVEEMIPSFDVTVENVNCTTALVGVHIFNKNSVAYANITMTVKGGTFANVYAGLSVTTATYTAVKLYGSTELTIIDGIFDGGVYGAGTMHAPDALNEADATMTIKGGEFAAGVFGGANLDANNANLNTNTTLNVEDGKFASVVYGGSALNNATAYHTGTATVNISGGTFGSKAYFYGGSELAVDGAEHKNDSLITVTDVGIITSYGGSNFVADNCTHSGKTTFTIEDGTYTANYLYGGSNISEGVKGLHSGEVVFTVEGGTFSGEFYGGSLLQNENAHHFGKITFSIYGGTTINGHVSGGSKLWFNGTGYNSEGGNGVQSSGDVVFNIYNKDKDGNSATVSLASEKRLYCAGYGTSSQKYREITGNTTYLIQGVTLPNESYGGMRSNSNYTRITGNITGTLEDMTVSGSFYGGSNLSVNYTSDEGTIILNLVDVDVTGTVAAASHISGSNSTVEFSGKSTLNYKSGNLTGKAVGGCYFTKAGVKITGDSELIFGTSTTTPATEEGSALIGGSLAAEALFTGAEATTAWGMYGSSDLVIKGGTVASNTYIVGGSFLNGSEAGLWANYPIVGGLADSEEHQKLKIEGGTVAGPRLYAGSYCNAGGQDHGTVELEITGGTVNLKTTDNVGIYNYSALADAIYPATYYPVNTKAITVDHVFKFTGGKLELYAASKTNVSGGPNGYNGTITGDTELTLNVDFKNGSSDNATYRVERVAGALCDFGENAQLIGNTTVNILGGYIQSYNPFTAGSYSPGTNRTDADENDGITYGFVQVGDVTLNINAGTIYRSTQASGYRANLDGNVTVNISGGQISRDLRGAGTASASAYSSVTGDIAWHISGGTITGGQYKIYGAGDASSSYNPSNGYNVIGGNVYMEISGGIITGTDVSLVGSTSLAEDKEARLKFVGNTFDVSGATISAQASASGVTYNDSVYTLDLTQSGKTVTLSDSSTKLDKIFNLMKDQTITISNFDPENAKFGDLADLSGKTFTWNGSTATYAELTAFDKYSDDYKNAICITDATTGNELPNGIFGSTGDIKVKCGTVYSAAIVLPESLKTAIANIKSNYQVVGTGIRKGNLAFRCRARIDQAFFTAHTGDTYTDGYKITKIGILVSTKSDLLEVGGTGISDAWAWSDGAYNTSLGGGAFATDAKNYPDSYLFQAAVTGYGTIDELNSERVNTNLSFRAYLVLEYEDGTTDVVYMDNPSDSTQTNYVKSLYGTATQFREAAASPEESAGKEWYNQSAENAETITKICNAVENAE